MSNVDHKLNACKRKEDTNIPRHFEKKTRMHVGQMPMSLLLIVGFRKKKKIKKNVELLLGCSLIGQQQPNQLMWWIILPLIFSAKTPLLTLGEPISYLCCLLWSSTSRSCNILWSWDFWYLILEPTSLFNFGHILYSFPLT